MKISTTATLVLAFLASSIAADPDSSAPKPGNTVTVQLANDQSGAWGNADVPADGAKHSIESLYAKTNIAKDGTVSATSTQLVKFQQNTVCKISKKPGVDVTLNSRETWKSLKGGAVVKLQGGTVECKNS
ncbi:hypothetical protein BDV29DRAFT_161363 [Aspergillus leporis]|jgi:hypothetical protein|uniref:Pectate lyase n=1 Tax=Aspergillus leporis TaxID=41062 RepID=A0A5N5WM39_9EURO|nr:hypothetical protein BDV29DRAFT_161363 [Aspergillus leporis]